MATTSPTAGRAGRRDRHCAGREPVGFGRDVEATHGTAPKYAGKDYVNRDEILSAEMMLRHMGWVEAADLIISSMEKAILSKNVTYDFARLLEGANQVSCSASARS